MRWEHCDWNFPGPMSDLAMIRTLITQQQRRKGNNGWQRLDPVFERGHLKNHPRDVGNTYERRGSFLTISPSASFHIGRQSS